MGVAAKNINVITKKLFRMNYEKIKLPFNHVLVLPDPDFTKYQVADLDIAFDSKTQAQHFSVRGRVFATPDQLIYNGEAIKVVRHYQPNDFGALKFISDFRSDSTAFNVKMEVEVGDIVYFQYTEHFACYKHHRWVETDLGDMLIMEYDSLICSHPGADEDQIRMLNGFIIVEPFKMDTILEDGIEMIKKGNFYIPVMKEEDRYLKGKKKQLGMVISIGEKCDGYLEFPDAPADPDVKVGDVILYNPAYALRLEPEFHLSIFGRAKVYRMHRKDIFGIFPTDQGQSKENLLSTITDWLTLK